jgi:hypothetical protein
MPNGSDSYRNPRMIIDAGARPDESVRKGVAARGDFMMYLIYMYFICQLLFTPFVCSRQGKKMPSQSSFFVHVAQRKICGGQATILLQVTITCLRNYKRRRKNYFSLQATLQSCKCLQCGQHQENNK